MDRNVKLLPDSVTNALKGLAVRIAGAMLLVLGILLVWGLLFHNPYLDGFAAASTFGEQS